MKKKDKFKEIEKIVNGLNIFKFKVDDSKPGDSIFTSSETMDINEMIDDDMSVDEIVNIIKQW